MMVRTTITIKNSIRSALKQSYLEVKDKATQKVPSLTSIKDEIYATYIGPYQQILDNLPKYYIGSQALMFNVTVVQAPSGTWRESLSYNSPFYAPNYSLVLDWTDLPEKFREEREAAIQTVAELEKRQKELVSHFEELYNNCSTVQQLVKAWPTVEMFLPEDVKNRMAAPEVRGRKKGSTKKNIVVHENLDALVALPILIKEP